MPPADDQLPKLHKLSCPDCDWWRICDAGEIIRRLTAARKYREGVQMDADIMIELFRVVASGECCPSCDRRGLAVELYDESAEWPDQATCEICGKLIPPARLRAVPGTTMCVECKSNQESGVARADQVEYCPRCGAILQMRSSGGGYVMFCGDCGYRG